MLFKYLAYELKISGSTPLERKVADISNKRLVESQCEGSVPIVSSPSGFKSSQQQIGITLMQANPECLSEQFGSSRPPELVKTSCLQIGNSEPVVSPIGYASHLQGSLSHIDLLSDHLSCQNEEVTLDSLAVQYSMHQRRQCPAPITTIPPLPLFHPRMCSEPSRVCYAPLNIPRRLFVRETIPPFGGIQGRRRDKHFVHSCFRPLRECRVGKVHHTCSVFLGISFRLAAACYAGEIHFFDCHSGNLIETHDCNQSFVTSLRSAPLQLDSSVKFTGSGMGHLLLSSGAYDARLWNSSALGRGPLYSFDGCKSARFNKSGSMIASISTENVQEVLLRDVPTGKLEQRLSGSLSSSEILQANVQCVLHFNPSDSLLLWNGVLGDHRVPRAIHRCDRVTDSGGGGFHPARNEVIINSEVWDLRFLKLLQSVPSLDQTVINFNGNGDVIYATARRNPEDICYRRRNKLQHFSAFRTIGAIDYTDIATMSVDHCILDLAMEPSDNLISVVALDEDDALLASHAKLYEIGRHKPTDDDSGIWP